MPKQICKSPEEIALLLLTRPARTERGRAVQAAGASGDRHGNRRCIEWLTVRSPLGAVIQQNRGQNMQGTKRGRELAALLKPYMGTTPEIVHVCSLIARHAKTHARYQEMWCNEEMSDARRARYEGFEAKCEARIRALVGRLPHTDDGPITVRFDGDPRDYTVKLKVPGPHDGNTWGRGGEFGV